MHAAPDEIAADLLKSTWPTLRKSYSSNDVYPLGTSMAKHNRLLLYTSQFHFIMSHLKDR